MKFISKHTGLTLKIISIIQIVGGIAGLLLRAYLLMHIEAITGPNLLIILIGLALFIFSAYCGKVLLTEKDKKNAIILSIANHVLQIFQWSMLGYSFAYSSGVSLTLGIMGVSIDFGISVVRSSFSMSIRSDNPFYFKINIAAVIIMCILIEIYTQLKKVKEPEPVENLVAEEEI
jgi:hypothetical protein